MFRSRGAAPGRELLSPILPILGDHTIGMRHFFAKALHAKANKGKPEIIDANMLQAVSIAEKIAPYRHHRLGAIKLSADPVDPGLRENASLEDLQAELLKHWERLAPVLDLKALMAPADGIANRDVPQGGADNDAEAPHE